MRFNDHYDLKGKHAILGASKYQWLNYDDERFSGYCKGYFAQTIGTVLHEFAAKRIRMRLRLHKGDRDSVLFYLMDHGIPKYAIDMDLIFPNLMMYINDGIGFEMSPEVTLKYSDNCFGTTDCVMFDERKRVLRISDYKSGSVPASMNQLLIYDAMFCLEYGLRPDKITVVNSIYQNMDILTEEPDAETVKAVMDLVVSRNRVIDQMK